MIRFLTLLMSFLFLSPTLMLTAQTIAKMVVEAGQYDRNNTPLSIHLDPLTHLPDSLLRLEEISGNQRIPVAFQIESGKERILWWILSGELKAGKVRHYELVRGMAGKSDPVKAQSRAGALTIAVGDKPVLQYNYETVYPPKGIDTVFRRSGFIHPLWSPKGDILTNIQPSDHYHHYGIWNPWTKTEFEGHEIDFWNLARKLGTVRFASFASIVEGPVYGGFKALHSHVVYPDSAEKIAMNEVWDVRVYNLSSAFVLDFTSTLNPATESPIKLQEYRYGGFGMRATAEWTNKNSLAFTSEGKTRKDADGSTARWCVIRGETGSGSSGILFMSYPANFNHPEPIRMWPEDGNNGRGDVFFNFCPTKNTNWNLTAGNEYTLRYRMVVFEGDLSREKAEASWIDFAFPPVISLRQ